MILKHWWIYCHMFTSHVVTCSRRVAVVLTPFVSNGRGHGDKNFQFPYFDRKFPPHARERKKEKTKAIIRARERGEKRKLQITQSPSYTRGALYSTFATVLRSVQFQSLDLETKPFQCDSKPKSKPSGESTRVT